MVRTTLYIEALNRLHKETGSWVKVGLILGLNEGLCWQVAKGRRGASPTVVCAIDSWLRLERSTDPDLLRAIRRRVVPFLRGKQGV